MVMAVSPLPLHQKKKLERMREEFLEEFPQTQRLPKTRKFST
jgi:hypothetical protein